MNERKLHSRKWVRVTEVENIPLREGRAVQIDGQDIAIFNLGDRFLAVENKCPHRGGPLADGIVSGGTVVCPLHAWKIDLASGEVLNQPTNPLCVTTYPARVENGIAMVEIPTAVSATTPVDCLASISRVAHFSGNPPTEV